MSYKLLNESHEFHDFWRIVKYANFSILFFFLLHGSTAFTEQVLLLETIKQF